MSSGLPLKADIAQRSRHVSKVPGTDSCAAYSEDWFNRPYLKFLQDAYMLAEFVNLAPVERVRLAGPLARWLREDRTQDSK